jgi:hypothetical protein
MIRRSILVVAILSGIGCSEPAPHDLAAYIDEIRAMGMTESARGSIQMIAGIKAGTTLLTFPRDEITGTYGSSYMSTACPAPGVDPEDWQAIQNERAQKVAAESEVLKPLVDTDGSGFISTTEGEAFRRIMEFGAKAAFVLEDLDHEMPAVYKAMAVDEEEFERTATQYNRYIDQLPYATQKPFVRLRFQR